MPLRGLVLVRGLMLPRSLMVARGLRLLRGPVLLHALMLRRSLMVARGLMPPRELVLLRGLMLRRSLMVVRGLLLLAAGCEVPASSAQGWRIHVSPTPPTCVSSLVNKHSTGDLSPALVGGPLRLLVPGAPSVC